MERLVERLVEWTCSGEAKVGMAVLAVFGTGLNQHMGSFPRKGTQRMYFQDFKF